MRFVLLLFCTVAAASAATGGSVRIEKWRVQTGDDIRWAQPGFDDSAWQVSDWPRRYNSSQPFFAGVRWYRANVSISPALLEQHPAIGIGPLDEVFDVYVNGIRAGGFGTWDPAPVGYFSRYLSFPIPAPALHGPDALVAIRRWTGRSRTNSATFAGSLRGSVPPEIAPQDLEEELQELRAEANLNSYGASLITSLGDLTAGLISLALFFAGRRKHSSNLWLGVALVAASLISLTGLVALSSLPLRSPVAAAVVFVQSLIVGFWYLFLASICPSLRMPLWITALLQSVISIALGVSHYAQWPIPFALQTFPTWLGMAATFAVAAVLLVDRRDAYSGWLAGALFLQPASTFWFTEVAFWLKTGNDGRYLHIGGALVDPRNVCHLLFAITALVVLYLRHRKAQELQAEELTAARLVQESLLAGRGLNSSAWRIDAAYRPVSDVGGDFYQKLIREDGSLVILVGDVSGKGLHAAMLVSHICGALSNERSREPGVVLSNLNIALAGRVRGGFITCCCARFDPDGAVTLANAGHLPPYVSGHEWVVEPGLPLGISAGVEYAEARRELGANDSVVFISDGVVEASNQKGELFGFESTRRIVKQSAAEIAEAAEAWGQNDDITVVTVRRNS